MQVSRPVMLFLLSAIGLMCLPHYAHLPVAIISYFYALLAWRFVCVFKPEKLPNKWLLLLLTIGAMVLLYLQHHSLFGRDGGTRLFVLALGLKLLEIKSERDLYLVCFLAFIVATSQFLYEQNVFMAVYIVAVSASLLAALVCINRLDPKPWAALKTSSLIVGQALPMAIVLFILFPRVEAPRWMLLGYFHQRQYQEMSDNT